MAKDKSKSKTNAAEAPIETQADKPKRGPGRPKQQRFAEIETLSPQHKQLGNLCERLSDQRHEFAALGKDMKQTKDDIEAGMRNAGLREFKYDGLAIELKGEEKLIITRIKDDAIEGGE